MWKLVTAPVHEPLTLTETKLHLRITGTEEDSLVNNLIIAARQHAENHLRRALVSQTWDYYLDDFSDTMNLQKSPISSITSVKYYDKDNAIQTLSTDIYDTDLVTEPARITRAYNEDWPDVYDRTNGVIIRCVIGYGDANDIPQMIKIGMLLYITYMYEHRGDESVRPPRAIYDLWNDYRVNMV
jgi:uncharacterized phiE125 gp8 family phage protein